MNNNMKSSQMCERNNRHIIISSSIFTNMAHFLLLLLLLFSFDFSTPSSSLAGFTLTYWLKSKAIPHQLQLIVGRAIATTNKLWTPKTFAIFACVNYSVLSKTKQRKTNAPAVIIRWNKHNMKMLLKNSI